MTWGVTWRGVTWKGRDGSGESQTEEYMDLVTTMGPWGSIPWDTWRDCVDSTSEMSSGRPKRGRAPRHVSSRHFQGASWVQVCPGRRRPGAEVRCCGLH